MASVGSLRDAIQTQLATISGLHAFDVATGSETLPAAMVFPAPVPSGDHTLTTGGVGSSGTEFFLFVVEIHASLAAGLGKAQDALDGYISTSGSASVAQAIHADQTLGGLSETANVRAFSAYQFSELNKKTTLMCQIPVEVWV